MATISTVHPLPLIDHSIETAKDSSLRTVFLHAPFPFFLYTAYVAGRAHKDTTVYHTIQFKE